MMWNSRQRHERWRDCELERYVTVYMVMRQRKGLLIFVKGHGSSLLTYICLSSYKKFLVDTVPINLACSTLTTLSNVPSEKRMKGIIKQHCTTHGNTPKGSGLCLNPKLIYSTRIHNISVQAHNLLQMIRTLTAT